MSRKLRADERQELLSVSTTAMSSTPGNPCYRKINGLP